MNTTGMELLLWARGTGFQLAVAIFVGGLVLQLVGIMGLGRKPDYSVPRGGSWGPGLREIGRRFWATPGMMQTAPVTHIAGHVFHIGLLIIVVLFTPHIAFIRELFGIGWPGLPSPLIDAVTVVTLLALLVVLYTRIREPVRRFLSDFHDYLVWTVTLLPVLTGYLAVHHMLLDYTLMLALHILSFELLLVLFPFTRLSHAVTLFIARWFNGAVAGRRGV